MNIIEIKTRLEKELNRFEKATDSKPNGWTDYAEGVYRGISRSIDIVDAYIDEQIERMVKDENEIYMAETEQER